eukprot:TRINITY_DN38513_c0_g2_i1.p1 TRINITY_DN38513_c0_g2~~TRINITY_DN38513_c0_g2_i1.p1  ORF type:complete len:245 (+),score=33.82 TRINITY_DN38513_c0_g2_i1:44-736(+)
MAKKRDEAPPDGDVMEPPVCRPRVGSGGGAILVAEDAHASKSESPSQPPQGTSVGDLARFVDFRKTFCANEDPCHPHSNALRGVPRLPVASERSLLLSQSDAQLIFQLGFTGACRLRQLRLRAPGDGRAPGEMRVFANRPNLDFAGAEDLQATVSIDLRDLWKPTEGKAETGAKAQLECTLDLKAALFQRVTELTLFVVDNVGDEDVTALNLVEVLGSRVHKVTVVEGVL